METGGRALYCCTTLATIRCAARRCPITLGSCGAHGVKQTITFGRSGWEVYN